MDRSSLLSLIFLSLISSALTSIDDPLIRQVVVTDGDDDLSNAEQKFLAFKTEYNKTYATQEEDDYRLGVFMSSLWLARRNRMLDPTAEHGVTQFSDLTTSEFCEQFLGLYQEEQEQLLKDITEAPKVSTDDLPASFDWRTRGAVTSGHCGSCWAFSTRGALEGAQFLATGWLVNLSEQQLADCDHQYYGCRGGLMTKTFAYLKNAGGVEQASDYPYTATNGTCKFNKSKIASSVVKYNILPSIEDQIAAYLVKSGPVTAALPETYLRTYKGGVSCPSACWRRVNHAMDSVGYGADRHWIIMNCWGDEGYYHLCRCRGRLTCVNPIAISVVATRST